MRHAIALAGALMLLAAPLAAQPVQMRSLAACVHDSFYARPALFGDRTPEARLTQDARQVVLRWFGPDFAAKGRLIPYAVAAFSASGEITVRIPPAESPLDRAIVQLAGPRTVMRTRIAWCRDRISRGAVYQLPGS